MPPVHSKPVSGDTSPAKKKPRQKDSPTWRIEQHCAGHPRSPARNYIMECFAKSPERLCWKTEEQWEVEQQQQLDYFIEKSIEQEQKEIETPPKVRAAKENTMKQIRHIETYLEWQRYTYMVERNRAEEAENQAIEGFLEDYAEEPDVDVASRHCSLCAEDPCVMDQFSNDFSEFCAGVEGLYDNNKQYRFAAYRFMARKMWGVLPKGVRKQLPKCAERQIRVVFPKDDNEEYTGFKSKDGNEKGNK